MLKKSEILSGPFVPHYFFLSEKQIVEEKGQENRVNAKIF